MTHLPDPVDPCPTSCWCQDDPHNPMDAYRVRGWSLQVWRWYPNKPITDSRFTEEVA